MLVNSPTTTKENTAGKIPGFLLSGFYDTNGANRLGVHGVYWSRTASSAQYAYDLYMGSSSVNASVNSEKYSGFALRCLAQ